MALKPTQVVSRAAKVFWVVTKCSISVAENVWIFIFCLSQEKLWSLYRRFQRINFEQIRVQVPGERNHSSFDWTWFVGKRSPVLWVKLKNSPIEWSKIRVTLCKTSSPLHLPPTKFEVCPEPLQESALHREIKVNQSRFDVSTRNLFKKMDFTRQIQVSSSNLPCLSFQVFHNLLDFSHEHLAQLQFIRFAEHY